MDRAMNAKQTSPDSVHPPLRPLSERQQQILEFIRAELQVRGYAPTVRDIVRHVGDRSPTSVHRHLKTLERHGLIVRDAKKSRSIRMVGEEPGQAEWRPESSPDSGLIGLPLAGVIAAGSPIEAIEQDERIDFDALFNRDGHFVLRVKGDSMIEDHIDDGDLVVVRQAERCREGDTVVALLEDGTATLKRFYREARRIRLQPANRALDPIYVRDVKILGVVVGVVRQVT
jgi:repressor LexA